ncbi:MAG: hypothetical protein A3B16_02070 [Candidatus Zambryskibacteria bacterium RIFCSPLOWO2_01_FULL_45_43]|nr:MAG: hypothetical protein A3B16_02070 [Candidatus Zambryskibacteria bacterium RIFCSPLOWO2_01_FULL_45_43]
MRIISSGKAIHSPEFHKKKVKAQRIRLFVYCLLSLVSCAVLIAFFRWEKFIVSEIVIAEEIAVDREEIMATVQDELAGYYLYVIPRSNTFLYRRGVIKEKLLEQFPRFSSLDLNLERFKKLVITAEERKPYALYCREAECFFLDEGGFIFAAAPSFSDGVYFIYKTETAIEDPMGKSLLLENDFRGLVKFLENLPVLGINSRVLEIGTEDYRLMLNSGGKIIWKRDISLGVIYSNLEAFLSDEAIVSQKDFLNKIEHLDLRTENKVFWKLK